MAKSHFCDLISKNPESACQQQHRFMSSCLNQQQRMAIPRGPLRLLDLAVPLRAEGIVAGPHVTWRVQEEMNLWGPRLSKKRSKAYQSQLGHQPQIWRCHSIHICFVPGAGRFLELLQTSTVQVTWKTAFSHTSQHHHPVGRSHGLMAAACAPRRLGSAAAPGTAPVAGAPHVLQGPTTASHATQDQHVLVLILFGGFLSIITWGMISAQLLKLILSRCRPWSWCFEGRMIHRYTQNRCSGCTELQQLLLGYGKKYIFRHGIKFCHHITIPRLEAWVLWHGAGIITISTPKKQHWSGTWVWCALISNCFLGWSCPKTGTEKNHYCTVQLVHILYSIFPHISQGEWLLMNGDKPPKNHDL